MSDLASPPTGVPSSTPIDAVARTPINWPVRVLATGVALLMIVGILAGTYGRLAAFSRDEAIIRVAWSARPERIETCRRLSDEELAKLPVHMRQRLECEGTTARYRLEVTRDGVLLDSATVQGGGMRHDREVYVSREVLIPPGPSRVNVRFVRIDSSSATGADDRGVGADDEPRARQVPDTARRADTSARTDRARGPVLADRSVREADERRRRRAEAIPPVLSLDTVVTLASRAAILVTYDPLLRRLVAKSRLP